MADAAADAAAIADAYGLDRFAVVGRSGGGPHALACAALLPERVTKAAVLVGIAPHGADGLDFFGGMAQSNVLEFTAAAAGYAGIAPQLHAAADAIRANPASLMADLHAELPDPDRRVVADSGIRSMLLETYAEALRTSAHGWINDALAFCSPWGFDPAAVTVPVLIWHGASDVFSPAGQESRPAGETSRRAVVVQAGAAHFGALDVLPDILRVAVRGPAGRVIGRSARNQPGTRRLGPVRWNAVPVAADPPPVMQQRRDRVAGPKHAAEIVQYLFPRVGRPPRPGPHPGG